MRTYWIECETIYATVMVSKGVKLDDLLENEDDIQELKSFEDYECLPDSKAYLKQAWQHAGKLAKQYAKRHNQTAIYTMHPLHQFRARAAWVVK